MQLKGDALQPYRTSSRAAATGATPPPPGTVLADRYLVELLLVERRSAWLLAAIDAAARPPRRVVLKVLRPADAASRSGSDDAPAGAELRRAAEDHVDVLLRAHEAGADVGLESPADAEVVEHRGMPVIALELVPGASVKEALARSGAMAPREVARIGARVALALSALHGAGELHGAVRPANIRLPEGSPAVLVGVCGRSELAAAKEGTDDVAPAGTGPADDVFALGLTLWEMAMGTRPGSAKRAVRAALTAAGSGAGRLPPALAAVMLSCLEEDPLQRPTAAEVASLLQATAGRAEALPATRALDGRKRRLAMVAFGVLGVALVGGTLALWRGPERPESDGRPTPTAELRKEVTGATGLGVDCKRSYHDIRDIPRGAQILDFETCNGCPCCDQGVFPRDDSAECNACAMGNVLELGGLSINGVEPLTTPAAEWLEKTPAPFGGHSLMLRHGKESVRIHLKKPVALFGVVVRPTALSGHRGAAPPPKTAGLTAFDSKGARIGSDSVDYDTSYDSDLPGGANFAEHARFLSVESCAGAVITDVDLYIPGGNGALDNLTLYPPAWDPG